MIMIIVSEQTPLIVYLESQYGWDKKIQQQNKMIMGTKNMTWLDYITSGIYKLKGFAADLHS